MGGNRSDQIGQRLVTVNNANTHHHSVKGFTLARIIGRMLPASLGLNKRATFLLLVARRGDRVTGAGSKYSPGSLTSEDLQIGSDRPA
jgi:hypothetical protein